jgi:hypothetical protein
MPFTFVSGIFFADTTGFLLGQEISKFPAIELAAFTFYYHFTPANNVLQEW